MCNRSSSNMVQKAGSKVYGPPDNWLHAPPSYHCELYIKNLPKDLNEEAFLALLKRFGFVYQLRLMTDSNKIVRGYAFTRYSIELDALAAMELLNRYFLKNGERLRACKSLNKRSLYVSNLPKELQYKDLYEGFANVFPRMRKLVLRSDTKIQNHGFAFIEFGNHEDAVEAKMRSAMGGIELWGVRLKIVWAQMQPTGVVKSSAIDSHLPIINDSLSSLRSDLELHFQSTSGDQRFLDLACRINDVSNDVAATRVMIGDIAEDIKISIYNKPILAEMLESAYTLPQNSLSLEIKPASSILKQLSVGAIHFRQYGCQSQVLSAVGILILKVEISHIIAIYQSMKNTLVITGLNNERYKDEFLKKIQNHVDSTDIKMMELVENQGVVAFNNPTVALKTYSELKHIHAPGFSVEWAKNGTQSWLTNRVEDFCAELRLICIANGWQIPIILFGKNFRKNNVQYGAVLLGDGYRYFISILMEVITINLYDIQSTMCEVVVGIINKIGGLPTQSVVYKVTNRSGHQVCLLSELSELHNNGMDRIRSWKSIQEMALILGQISLLSDQQILSVYRKSFLASAPNAPKAMEQVLPNCLPVYPKYRNKPSLIFNMNDTEIILVLRDNTSNEMLPPIKYIKEQDENTIYLSWKKKPNFLFNYIDAGSIDFYHPNQRVNVAPVWIPGHTYRHSLKNFLL